MAEALAEAGADIIGVSAHARALGSEIERAVTAHGRSFEALAVRLRRPRRRRRARRRPRGRGASTSWSTTPAPSSARPPPSTRSTCGTASSQVEPVEPVRAHAGRRPADARTRSRQDHLHRVAAELPGRHQRARLHGGQVRHRRPDQGARQRVGAARRERQRDRARLHRDRQHRRRCAPIPTARARSSSASPPAAGATPTTSPERRSSSRRRASDYVSGIVLPVDGGWLGR